MYIIGKNKDYYDSIANTMGIDKSLVYNRHLIEFENNNIPNLFKKPAYASNKERKNIFLQLGYFSINKENQKKHHDISFFIVGFCGKLYVGWKLYNIINNKLVVNIIYDFDYIKTILEHKAWFGGNIVDVYNNIIKYDAMPIFREYKTPVFIYDDDFNRISIEKYFHKYNYRFLINPILKDYEFYKIFDSFQAFQEIQMFLGGVISSNEKEIIEIDDKYKIIQHGFDNWSFRKEPQKIIKRK